jgi:hypothetical protein
MDFRKDQVRVPGRHGQNDQLFQRALVLNVFWKNLNPGSEKTGICFLEVTLQPYLVIGIMTRFSLFVCVLFCTIEVFAQSDTLLAEPSFQVITTDDTGAMSNYIRYDYYRKQTYSVIISADDKIVMGQFRPAIPDQFKYKVKVDSNFNYGVYDYKTNTTTRPDSIERTDYARADSFLLHVAGFVFDTIWLQHYYLMPSPYYSDEVCAIAQYYYNQKHGYEETFYSTDDLKGILITGPNYKSKARGMWKLGQKVGKWYYYSPNGELQRTEKWRRGKLVKTKYPN